MAEPFIALPVAMAATAQPTAIDVDTALPAFNEHLLEKLPGENGSVEVGKAVQDSSG